MAQVFQGPGFSGPSIFMVQVQVLGLAHKNFVLVEILLKKIT